MIRVVKNLQVLPLAFSGENYEAKVRVALNEKNSHNFNSRLYRNGCYAELNNIYQSKCGYCESNSAAAATFRVDHFRPKNQIINTPGHLGYYWLGYEWSNLILSCEKCNRKKSNHFPIENEANRIHAPVLDQTGLPENDYRIVNSEIWRTEGALLLNPEIDDVDEHLYFNPDGGIRHLTARGEITIELCGLNREDLVLARKKVIDDFRNKFIRILADYKIGNIDDLALRYALKLHFDNLLTQTKTSSSYSRMGWFMINKFDLFFSRYFGNEDRGALNLAFRKYLENTL
jgi:uncharacterized protein (TIGR02646 family)